LRMSLTHPMFYRCYARRPQTKKWLTMTAFEDAAGLREAAMGREVSVETMLKREQKVRRDFWRKLRRVASHVPFVEDGDGVEG